MIVWILSITTLITLLVVSGALIQVKFERYQDQSTLEFILTSFAIGLGILPVISYLLIGLNVFTPLTTTISILILIVVIFAILFKEKKINMKYRFHFQSNLGQRNSKQFILLLSLILIMVFAFILSIRAIYNRFTLLEIDPWYWLYNTRFLMTENALDYSSIRSYPAGMAFFTVALIYLEPTYEFLYVLYRFFGPTMSSLVVLTSFVVGTRAFPDKIAPTIIIALASAVSHHLLFAYYLARPETIAIFLFIISLNYIFQSENPSPFISTMLLIGIFLYHPLTCAVLLGIFITSRIHTYKILLEKENILTLVKCGILALLLSLPFLILHSINIDVVSGYGYYFDIFEEVTLWAPWIVIQDRVNYLAQRSVGIVLFGVVAFEAVRTLFTGKNFRWAASAWFFIILWMMFSWVPILFVAHNARRAATWSVLPFSILIAKSFVRAEDYIVGKKWRTEIKGNDSHHNGIQPNLRKYNVMACTLLIVLLSTQIMYGLSYSYLGQRYISSHDQLVFDYIAQNYPELDAVFVYDSHLLMASAILHPLNTYSNNSLRHSGLLEINDWFNEKNSYFAVYTKESETLHTYATLLGWHEIFNCTIAESVGLLGYTEDMGIHVFLSQPTTRELTLVLSDSFDDTSYWNIESEYEFTTDGNIGYLNITNTSDWIELYTNQPNLTSQEDLLLEVRYMVNASNVAGEIIGTQLDDLLGNQSFRTKALTVPEYWETMIWRIPETSGYNEGDLQCIAFRLYSPSESWSFLIDYFRLYRIES